MVTVFRPNVSGPANIQYFSHSRTKSEDIILN